MRPLIVPFIEVQASDIENALSPLFLTVHEEQLPANVVFLESLTYPCLLFDPGSSAMLELHLATAFSHAAHS